MLILENGIALLLDSLSLREKIGQTAIEQIARLPLADFSEATVAEYLKENPIGSLFLAGEIIKGDAGSAEVYRQIIDTFQKLSTIPFLVAGDLEHGAGSAIKQMTKFPDLMALGAANDEKLAYDFGKYTAIEGCSVGFNWTFSPVVDVLKNWLNPIVSNRGLGSFPEHIARMAAAIVKGMQENRLAACAKHFPGDGVDFRDQHICTSVNSLSEDEWWGNHGAVFQAMIDSGVQTIMTGHIALPWIEKFDGIKQRYRPATVSRIITTELLRNRMGFKGVVVSDALDMGGYVGWDNYEERTIECFNSGTDAMLWPGPEYINIMERAILEGKVSMERLNESVRRILELKESLGLLKQDTDIKSPIHLAIVDNNPDVELSKLAKNLSREIAARSMTLVRNRKNLLPLHSDKVKRILIGKMSKITEDREFPIDYFLSKLTERGIETHVIENWDPAAILIDMKSIGYDWDAFLMPFILRTHGLINTVRPVGESARAIWSSQIVEQLHPIVISMGTPFLLMDMPYVDTLINSYSPCEDSVDMLVKALFGEIAFTDFSPVEVGGW
jgi:beta-N-acetylhexosaminidase